MSQRDQLAKARARQENLFYGNVFDFDRNHS